MEDIKVGEYVRTKIGYIAKVKNIICKGYPIKSLENYIICDDEDGTILKDPTLKEQLEYLKQHYSLLKETKNVDRAIIEMRGNYLRTFGLQNIIKHHIKFPMNL